MDPTQLSEELCVSLFPPPLHGRVASAIHELRERCRIYAADGRVELFKMTVKYDAKVGPCRAAKPSVLICCGSNYRVS